MADYKYPKVVIRPEKPPEAWGRLDRSNAVEKWGSMRETTVKHFKFTPRTSAYAILWAGVVPIGLMSLIKWHLRRKDRLKGIEPRKLF